MKIYWHELTIHKQHRLMEAVEKGVIRCWITNYSVNRMVGLGLLKIERSSKSNMWYSPTPDGIALVRAYLIARLGVVEITNIKETILEYHAAAWKNLGSMWGVENLNVYIFTGRSENEPK